MKLGGIKFKLFKIQVNPIKLFQQKIVTLYDNYFPEKTIEIKNKYLQSPWITSRKKDLLNVSIVHMKNS